MKILIVAMGESIHPNKRITDGEPPENLAAINTPLKYTLEDETHPIQVYEALS